MREVDFVISCIPCGQRAVGKFVVAIHVSGHILGYERGASFYTRRNNEPMTSEIKCLSLRCSQDCLLPQRKSVALVTEPSHAGI